MPTILLVTERPLSDADVVDLTALDGATPADLSFYVAVPQHRSSESVQAVLDNWEYLDAGGKGAEIVHEHPEVEKNPGEVVLHDAERVLAQAIGALSAAGSKAEGEVTPVHALETIGDLLESRPVDEVVVVVTHHKLKGAFHTDLAAHIKRSFDVPVLKVKAHTD
ncbi:MAG: hypothetical protein WAN48_06165 [Actinomycetes bacterium]